jgi:hypothetical protein
MKTYKKSTTSSLTVKIIILAFFLLPWLTLSAQDFTKTYYQEKYDVDKGASLVIQNKFGDIHCQAWDESSVDVTVTVKVDASSQEKADRVFDKIQVKLTGTRTKVEGITTVGSISNANYSIDYDIRMPRWINIDFENKFGDIYLDESDGPVKINLEYGAMEANAFNGPKTELTLKFSNGKAGFMKDGTLNIEYGEWKSTGTENLQLYSRFSEINIEKLVELNVDSQYDEVKIGSSGPVISISRFSELEFDKINGDFDFDAEYGDITIHYISPAFKVGKVRNSFAGTSLSFDPKTSMNVDAELDFGELSYPENHTSISHETVGYTKNIYKGKIGTSASPVSQLTIISKNADVDIDFEE